MDKNTNGQAVTIRRDDLPVGTVDQNALAKAIGMGDLAGLSAGQRLAYIARLCESVGLNPLGRPFEIIEIKGKVVLYARKEAAEQLASLHGASVAILKAVREEGGIYVVDAVATLPNGRRNMDSGIVSIQGLVGENLANAIMKARSKARRRALLGLCGLGWLDERPDVPPLPQVDARPAIGQAVTRSQRSDYVTEEGEYRDFDPETGEVMGDGASLETEPDVPQETQAQRQTRVLAEVVEDGFDPGYVAHEPAPAVQQAAMPMANICQKCQRNEVRASAFDHVAKPIQDMGSQSGWCVPCCVGEINKLARQPKPAPVGGGSR